MIDRNTKVSLGLTGTLIASMFGAVLWIVSVVGDAEKSHSQGIDNLSGKMQTLAEQVIRNQERDSALLDKIDALTDSIKDGNTGIRAMLDSHERRIMRLDEQ